MPARTASGSVGHASITASRSGFWCRIRCGLVSFLVSDIKPFPVTPFSCTTCASALTALEAVNATLVSGTSNVVAGAARIIAFPWLTDQSKWYLVKTDGVVRPFIFQDREPVEFTALTEESDEGFRREKFLFGVRARYRMAFGYWQHAIRLDFTLPT